MVRLDIKRNFRYWIIVAVLLMVDLGASWIAFSRALLPYFQDAGIPFLSVAFVFSGIQLFWFGVFFLNGRYRVDPTLSRYGEIESVFKLSLGWTIIAVIYNEVITMPFFISSIALLQYWILFAFMVSTGRLLIRVTQKLLLKRGYGLKNTIIVGVNRRAQNVAERLGNYHLGYNVVGFLDANSGQNETVSYGGIPVLASVGNLREAILEHRISEVVIALEKPDHDRLLDIITLSNGSPVSLKIIPDMYEVVSGLAKTEQIHGLPLIQINPEIMTMQQRFFKRLIDIIVSLFVLVCLFPIWLILAIAIKVDSKGPALYRQERVGLNGGRFKMYKFRSMVQDAEIGTGPVWAREDDPRITKVGRFMRRFRLDEVPQFINVLAGDMSVVGPRPERPYFIQQLTEEFPFYYRRYKIRPGITGWAQVKHSYDTSMEDVRRKLKYDFFYIENLSLSLDLNIMISTVSVMLSGVGH